MAFGHVQSKLDPPRLYIIPSGMTFWCLPLAVARSLSLSLSLSSSLPPPFSFRCLSALMYNCVCGLCLSESSSLPSTSQVLACLLACLLAIYSCSKGHVNWFLTSISMTAFESARLLLKLGFPEKTQPSTRPHWTVHLIVGLLSLH